MRTVTSDEQLTSALASLDEVSREMPVYVSPDDTALLQAAYLDEDTINNIRAAGTESRAYKVYMAWRRRRAVRLYAQNFTQDEIAEILGVSTSTIKTDIAAVRKLYEGAAKKDWTLLVEDRLMQIDADIQTLRGIMDANIGRDVDLGLRVLDRIVNLEAKRDKLLGLDKAAGSQYGETTRHLVVNLSFDNVASDITVPALPAEGEILDV